MSRRKEDKLSLKEDKKIKFILDSTKGMDNEQQKTHNLKTSIKRQAKHL